MNKKQVCLKNHVPEKLSKIHEAVETIENLSQQIDSLSESIFLDIIDGWSTGNKLLDFAIISCNGVYDTESFTKVYAYFSDLGLRKPGQKIIVIQKSEFWHNSEKYLLRNIHLAELRQDSIETDINSLSMRLPVKPGHIVWKEFFQDKGVLISGHKMSQDKWLLTGPFHNEYNQHSTSTKHSDGFMLVPDDASCDILLVPETDKISLLHDHGIHECLLSQINKIWIRNLSSA
jgi:hypothetical protein